MAGEKVKIIMLTCICPEMSAANHTLNSLRYAERLKDKTQGQGGSGARGKKAQKRPREEVDEELRLFMKKHGKSLSNQANLREIDEDMEAEEEGNANGLQNMFYQDERLDQLMEDDDQDDMLNDQQNELLLQQEMEDELAVIQNQSNPLTKINSNKATSKSQ